MTTHSDTLSGSGSGQHPLVEGVARDLLALIRAVRVYPEGHQFPADLSERLVMQVANGFSDPLSLGVTPDQLTLGENYIGGRYRRSGELARLLHERKVARLVVHKSATATDLAALAKALSDPRLIGPALQGRITETVAESITLDPLRLEKIHAAFREESGDQTRTPRRGQEAWRWLSDGEVTPGRIAALLTAETTWDGFDAAADDSEAGQLTALLFRIGDRLSEALARLPAGRREDVRKRFAEVGRRLSPRQLASLLRQADAKGVLEGPIGDALEQAFGGDKLLDLLAGLVVEEGLVTRRLSEVYARFATNREIDDFLSTVREKMGAGGTGEFAADVWAAVESFLLSLQESSFMDTDYSATLESVAAKEHHAQIGGVDVTADLEVHLDAVLVGLGIFDPQNWSGPCLARLEHRFKDTGRSLLLGLMAELDSCVPSAVDTRPELVERIFHHCARHVRDLEAEERDALVRFAQRHEAVLLGPVFRALLLEEQIAVRRFLVDVVAAFSPASTPSVVSHLRSSPWYVTRNLTIAMGRRGEVTTVPVLQSLLQHDHAKVRREAILALGRFRNAQATQALATVVHDGHSSPEDRHLAARAMESSTRPEELR